MPAPSLYRQDPFHEMRRLKEEVNRLFQTAAGPQSGGYPAINVYGSKDGVEVTAEIPGIAPEDLDVAVHRDTVTMKGERKLHPEGAEAWHRRERSTGSFVRTIELPFVVDPDKVEANYTDGVLRLSLQRPEADKPKPITVRSN